MDTVRLDLADVIERDDVVTFRELINKVSPREFDQVAWEVVSLGASKILSWWLENGFDISWGTHQGTLIYSAAVDGHAEVIRLLLRAGVPPSGAPLVCAAASGSLEAVRVLVEGGVDPNQGYAGFPTPLGSALQYGHEEIAEYLRAHGATKLVGDGSGVEG